MKRLLLYVCAAGALLLSPGFVKNASAVPVLQLDMQGGVYDPITQTIVAPGGGPFTLIAVLTPPNGATAADVATLLSTNFYISAALMPQTGPTGTTAGSFTMGPQGGPISLINATSDMTYGVPPLETTASLQGFDPNDLSQHGIYPTYFKEFMFNFSSAFRAATYNTATNPGGFVADPNGGSYVFMFTGNTALLGAGYNLHFDLYSEAVKNCATRNSGPCTDVDVNQFAPFSHDAQTTAYNVPEPGSAMALLVGVGLAGWRLRRRVGVV